MTTAVSAPQSQALGTYVQLAVTEAAALPHARKLLQCELDDLDRTCSRFRADSELSRANAAAGSPVPASARLRGLVRLALDVAEATDGLVDPTLGHAITTAGYDRDFAELSSGRGDGQSRPSPLEGASALALHQPGARWPDVKIDECAGTLLVPHGCSLDLGAIAKAAGADRAAATIAQTLGAGALVSLGGDVAMQGPSPDGGWPVRVVSTTASDVHRDTGEVVMLSGGGLATSSPGARRWLQDGEPRHHIIDPRTLRPADTDWLSITVAAHDCVAANAAATAGVVLAALAPHWLEGTGYPCRLVDATGGVLRLGSWPTPGTWSP